MCVFCPRARKKKRKKPPLCHVSRLSLCRPTKKRPLSLVELFSLLSLFFFLKREKNSSASTTQFFSITTTTNPMMRLQRAAREGWEGAIAGALARSVVDLFPSFFYSSSSSSDDDDDDDDDEDEEEDTKLEADDMFEKTTTTTVEKNDDKKNKDKKRTTKRQTMKLRLFAEDFLYFSLVNVVSENRTRKSDFATTTVEAFRRYAVAGAISTALMLPFDIVTLQMKKIEAKMKKKGKASSSKSSNSKNRMKAYVSAMKEAYKRDGALAFQRGFQNVPLIVSHTINLAAFDALKALKTKYGEKKVVDNRIVRDWVLIEDYSDWYYVFALERTRALVEASSKSFHREEEENP